MNTRRERSKGMRALLLWDRNDAIKAIPYLHSVIGSLREHWLEIRIAQRQLDRLADRPATRQHLIEQGARRNELDRAQRRFDDALDELHQVDAYLVDPVCGMAFLPSRMGDDLAWYVFDQFTPSGLIGWRYHDDPIDVCRPLDTPRARRASK